MKYRKSTYAEARPVLDMLLTHKMLAVLLAAALAFVAGAALAQSEAIGEFGETQIAPLTPAELEELVGPIALYPDDLVSIILPASTYPLQIVEAARLLEDLEDDPNLEPDPDWDNSIVALVNYPEALMLLNDDLDWTWSLGQAVLNQQPEVIDAIQDFRERAYLAGNLATDERQLVTEDDGVIEIAPADPEVIYVPYYNPAQVVVYQPRPVYFYYDYGYPLYYYPYPIGYRFRTGFFWGVTSAFSIGWHTHYLHVHHHSHYGHPYYRYPYYSPYYTRRTVNYHVHVNNVSHVWRPTYHRAARPQYRTRTNRVVRTRQDYANDLRRVRQQRSISGRTVDTRSSGASRRTGAPTRSTANDVRRQLDATRTNRGTRTATNRAAATNRPTLSTSQRNTGRGAVAGRPSDRNVSQGNARNTRRVESNAGANIRSDNRRAATGRTATGSSRATSSTANRGSNTRPPTFAARPSRQTSNRTGSSTRLRVQTGSSSARNAAPRTIDRSSSAGAPTFAAPGRRGAVKSQPPATSRQPRVQTGNRAQATSTRSSANRGSTSRGSTRSSTARTQSGRHTRVTR